jgi:hypothetical protein
VNPNCHVIITVSPVPLIATYEARHVLVSNSFSKAALRVAADEAERAFEHVSYFPSYEIITSPASEGRYYADDLRQVTELGIGHVMRVFSRHFIRKEEEDPFARLDVKDGEVEIDVVCDEEAIERSLERTRASNP